MSKKIDYAKQYQHPKWQKKRLEILEREDYTCQDCGDTEIQLHIHHGHYSKGHEVWDYDNETLWCLCEPCHESWEIEKSNLYYNIARMKLKDIDFLNFQIQGIVQAQINGAL